MGRNAVASISKAVRKRKPHVILVIMLVALAVVITSCSSSKKTTSTTSSGGSASSTATGPVGNANEIGISATEIKVGLIADVNTPVLPGLFQKSVDLVNAWAAIVNKAGGVAGRKVTIDFCDSKLDANATTNCVINACANDFAIISEADVLTDTADLDNCKDKSGASTGIPNFAVIAFPPLNCDKVSYTVSGQADFCATQGDKPQTYTVNVGDMRYYTTHFQDLHGVWVYNGDVPAVRQSSVPGFTIGSNLGIKKDGQGFYTSSGSAPQSALTPLVQVLKNNKSTFGYDGSTNPNYIQFRNEAQLQGVSTVKVWASNSGIYDNDVIKQGGANVEGTWAGLPELPFYSEYQSNPALAALVKQIGDVNKLSNNSIIAYEQALLFQDIVTKAAAAGGTLNRAALFTALNNEHAFDAQGIIGATDIAAHKPSPCIVMVKIVDGKWTRQFPTKEGTFDCSADNVQTIKLDLTK
jgi:hypothetical protein